MFSCDVAIYTGNELSRREDFDGLMSSSVIDEPRSDSGTGPNVPAPRTYVYVLIRTLSYLRSNNVYSVNQVVPYFRSLF